jgi:acetylornithine deacetylase/succinyl-diaminopimelate desuccinylase
MRYFLTHPRDTVSSSCGISGSDIVSGNLVNQQNKVKRALTKEEIVKFVQKMVQIPSHPAVPTRETEVAKFMHEYLVAEGIKSKLRFFEKNRPNLIATLEGSGSGKNLMLNGHTDTVLPYEMDIPPFSGKVSEGKLYGRGAIDMKGGTGSMALSLVALNRANINLRGDLILTAVAGEESSSEGTEDIVLHGPKADAGINSEPSYLEIQPVHRGLEWIEIHVYGKAAHGGEADKGINAISKAVKVVNALERDLLPKISERRSKVRHMKPPTLNLGVIRGGQQPSSVADHCLIMIDRRWIPEETYEQVYQELEDIFDDIKKEDPQFKAKANVDPTSMRTMQHGPNVVPENHAVVRSMKSAFRTVTGKPPKVGCFWAWTDAAILTNSGKIPTVVFGPGGAGAHARTEYVLTNDLVTCTQVYANSAMNFCGVDK